MMQPLPSPIKEDIEFHHVPLDEEEGGIPRIPIVDYAVPEDKDTNNNNISNKNKKTADTAPRRVFQVVAPSNLYKGFRLNVTVLESNEEVVVLVPPGGVKKFQTFEAKEARPIEDHWSDGEFDCAPNYEGFFCYIAALASPLGWAFLMKKLGLNICGYKPSADTEHSQKCVNLVPCMMGLIILVYMFVDIPYLVIFIGMYFVYIGFATRVAVRNKYRIRGTFASDIMWTFFFPCCTILQSYRHMKRNGDTPYQGCTDTIGAVEIVSDHAMHALQTV